MRPITSHDYNWFYNNYHYKTSSLLDNTLIASESESQLGTQDPFIDWQNRDFELKEATDSGIELPWMDKKDMFGIVRGLDGNWDRGALEYDPNQAVVVVTEPQPEPEEEDIETEDNTGIIITDQTLLMVSNNIIKAGGNSSVNIDCGVNEAGKLTVKIYDAQGKEIIVLWDGYIDAGPHSFPWAGVDAGGSKVGSGIYLIHMRAGNYEEIKKIAVVK